MSFFYNRKTELDEGKYANFSLTDFTLLQNLQQLQLQKLLHCGLHYSRQVQQDGTTGGQAQAQAQAPQQQQQQQHVDQMGGGHQPRNHPLQMDQVQRYLHHIFGLVEMENKFKIL
jgi:hypothetical protein